MKPFDRRVLVRSALILLTFALGCASGGDAGRGWRNQRPQLYPNAHYQQVGMEVAEMDVAACMSQADRGAPTDSVAKDAAINTVGGAAGGAALGAIGGAIAGNAGTGAAAGAAVGATVGAGKTIYDTSKPQESYKGWTDACLREKGYEVIGWK